MSTHQASEPAAVRRYFAPLRAQLGFTGVTPFEDHAVVTQVFRPGVGWARYPWRKRVSGNWARQARCEDITAVALSLHGRTADFTIEELVKR